MAKKTVYGEKHYHEAKPVPEEPLENMPRSPLRCEICGRVFSDHSQVDRHMQTMHGSVEGRELEGS